MMESLLAELVAFETVSETSNLALQQWLAEQLAGRGAEVKIVEGATGRANLVAYFGPNKPGGVLFSGHTDVVPPGQGWATNPWVLTKHGDRLYGRGTADMKGFFAALLVGLDQVDLASLSAPVRVLASYDEEVGCAGVRQVLPALAEDGPLDPAIIIIGEPTGMRPGRSHPGKRVVRLEVTAAEAHSSKAADYPSAISGTAVLVRALDQIQAACPPALPGEGPVYSLNVGTISGGSQANLIAGSCALVYEIRFALDQNPEQILAPLHEAMVEVGQRLAPLGGVAATELFNYPALHTDDTQPAFAQVVRLADNGPATGVGFGTEGGLLAGVFSAPITICGPGHIADAHQPNEYVSLEQLNRCAQFVSSVAQQL